MSEAGLRALEIDWPGTPDFAARLILDPRGWRRRAPLVLALAAAAVAAAFAVPQSRSAILDFFGLGGVTVEHVQTLPPAEQRPLAEGLGIVSSDGAAKLVLGTDFLPPEHGTLYQHEGFVSTLLAGPVLLTEFGNGSLI